MSGNGGLRNQEQPHPEASEGPHSSGVWTKDLRWLLFNKVRFGWVSILDLGCEKEEEKKKESVDVELDDGDDDDDDEGERERANPSQLISRQTLHYSLVKSWRRERV